MGRAGWSSAGEAVCCGNAFTEVPERGLPWKKSNKQQPAPPKSSEQSGERDPQLGISKAGSGYLRKLLVQGSHHILGFFGKESNLRTWG